MRMGLQSVLRCFIDRHNFEAVDLGDLGDVRAAANTTRTHRRTMKKRSFKLVIAGDTVKQGSKG